MTAIQLSRRCVASPMAPGLVACGDEGDRSDTRWQVAGPARADGLIAAPGTPMAGRVNEGRQAVMGHSMGAGGALIAANTASNRNHPSTNAHSTRYAMAWLLLHVNDDIRYRQFLVPDPMFSRFDEVAP